MKLAPAVDVVGYRFVLPLKQTPLLDDAGFLRDVDGQWPMAEEELQPVPMWDLLTDRSSFVLLAAGGAGKSRTFQAMADLEPGATLIDVAPLDRAELGREIDAVCATRGAAYLDGLDQAAASDPRLLQWLQGRLTAAAARPVSWRLSCRSAAWRTSFSGAMHELLPGFKEWRLLPLHRDGVERAVASRFGADIDAAAFVRALADARLGSMSACISQVLATASLWIKEGTLPASGVRAMEYEMRTLLSETNDWVDPRLSIERRTLIARRLAAFAMFGRRQTLSTSPSSHPALVAGDLPSDPEPTEPGNPVSTDEYREVLGTALFDAGPAGTVVFRHQRYVEFLAADYLSKRDVSRRQVVDLVGARASGILPASMIGVVAWLIALHPGVVSDLLTVNAAELASVAASVELPHGSAREAVVEAILDAAQREEMQPDWSIDLSTYAHPGIGGQLTSRLEREHLSSETVWWVARFADACACLETAATLVGLANDRSLFGYARRAAATAVGRLGDDENRRALGSLLRPAPDEDHDNEVLAAVLDVLYPRLLSTTEMLAALRPQTTNLLGGYRVTMSELATRIPDDDVAAVAIALTSADRWTGEKSHLDPFLLGLVHRAWDRADDDVVCPALADLLVCVIRSGQRTILRREKLPWMAEGTDRRRRLASLVAHSTGEDVRFIIWRLGLVNADDVGWLLDTAEAQAAEQLATLVPMVVNEPTAEVADRILSLAEHHPAYGPTSHLRGSVSVDDPAFATERSLLAEENAHERRLAVERSLLVAQVAELVGQLDADPLVWWQIVLCLGAASSPEGGHQHFGFDITRRPGWGWLTVEQRSQVLDGGVRYLTAHQPDAKRWWTLSTVESLHTVGPDWFGVQMLTTLLRHDEQALTDIDADVWTRWAPSIIATWGNTLDDSHYLRSRLIDAAPASVRQVLATACLERLDALPADRDVLGSPDVYATLGADIAGELAERLIRGRCPAGLAEQILGIVIDHSPTDTSLAVCRSVVDAEDEHLAAAGQRYLAARTPETIIDDLRSRDDLTPELIVSEAAGLAVDRLDDTHTAAALSMLLDAFPYADDPPLEEAYWSTPAHEARDLRDRLVNEAGSRGLVAELESLLTGRRDADRRVLRRHLLRARRRRAELADIAISPRAVLELLRRGDARLVRDDGDLLDVFVRHLEDLQHNIRYRGAFQDLWNENSTGVYKPKIEDAISDWVQRWTEERRGPNVIVDREVQVARLKMQGTGTRMDLTLTAGTDSDVVARVHVEAKRVGHSELMTAMHDQLIGRYLKPLGKQHGVYLVYWVRPEQRPDSWSAVQNADPDDLLAILREQADEASQEGISIVPFVLDISRPTDT